MAFDGLVTASIVNELNNKILNGRIDKIHQPERDEIIISVRTPSGNYKLLLSASSSNPRVHLTNASKENPLTAPMFCMVLRKHLSSGKIISLSQNEFDRVIKIDIESYTELGDLTKKSLVAEIMGRHSNIILFDDSGKILDSVKHVDFTVSAVRQILPGLIYELPPKQDKINPKDISAEYIEQKLKSISNDTLLDKFLLSAIMGLSPLVAREIVYRFSKNTKTHVSEIDINSFSKHIVSFFDKIVKNEYNPVIVTDSDTKKPIEFSCIKINQYEKRATIFESPSPSEVVDTFYTSHDMHERITQKSASLVKLVNNNIDRCNKKISIHKENLKKSENRDTYKIYGDLLTANMFQLEYGMDKITVQNYYSESLEDITIALKPELSPSKNAQRYYKLYNKAKTTEKYSLEQIKNAEEEKYYLETVMDSVLKAENHHEILEIRDELIEQGYISKINSKKNKNTKKSSPMEFTSSDGYTILVGRNNKQNDELTIRTAFSTDIWLHTKVIPGSHTIIRTKGERNIPETTILEAAQLAAFYSKAKNSTQVPVDFTPVKNVKKPNGSKPGFVIYDSYNTVYVAPDESLAEKLKREP